MSTTDGRGEVEQVRVRYALGTGSRPEPLSGPASLGRYAVVERWVPVSETAVRDGTRIYRVWYSGGKWVDIPVDEGEGARRVIHDWSRRDGYELDGKACTEQGFGRLLTIGSCDQCSHIRYDFPFGVKCAHVKCDGRRLRKPYWSIPEWCPLPCASLMHDYDTDDVIEEPEA